MPEPFDNAADNAAPECPGALRDEAFHRLQRMAWGRWGKPPLYERRRLAPLAEAYAAGYHEAHRSAEARGPAGRRAYEAGRATGRDAGSRKPERAAR